MPRRRFRSRAQPYRARDILRPRPPVALVMPAMQNRTDPRPLAHVKRADSLGRVNLVTADRVEVHTQGRNVDRQPPSRLHAIGVQQYPGRLRKARNLEDRLRRSQFVIRVHHRNQRRIRPQRATNIIRIDNPVRAHGDVAHLAPFAFDLCARPKHRRVLDGTGDHMLALAGSHRPQQREVVSLGPTAREDNILRPAMQQRGGLPASHFEALLGHLPEMVNTGRVAVHFAETRRHRLEDVRRHRGCRVVVEVVALHSLLF